MNEPQCVERRCPSNTWQRQVSWCATCHEPVCFWCYDRYHACNVKKSA